MAQSMVNFRLDSEVKKSMEEICDDLGMSLSTAFTMFAKKFIKERGMPFELVSEPFYSESNIKAIEKAIKEVKEGKVVIKTIEELEAMENE